MSDLPRELALSDRILARIRRKPGQQYLLKNLAEAESTGTGEVVAAIHELRDCGYVIRLTKEKARFRSAPDILSGTEISHQLKSKTLGQTIHGFRQLQSTNDLASDLAAHGADEGTIVTADQQTRGRGRHGRGWHSPPETGIYVSIVLRPEVPPEKAPGLSLVAALALTEAIKPLVGDSVRIKWPNDVLIAERKTAGILTELVSHRNVVSYVIVGVGVNVNQQAGDFPEELRDRATSIRRVTRKKQSRVELLCRFLERFEKEYRRFVRHGLKPARKALRSYSTLIGRQVRLSDGRRTIEAEAVDIDAEGRLVIRRDGKETAVYAGEVTVLSRPK
jgi:BirA family biotin operon repressor/biotin-[acetyl-CoA-carboxylase] ligase